MFTDLKKRGQRGFRAEFVPGLIQYISVYIFCFWKMLRTGSPFWFTATNPGIPLGGFFPTSKREVLQQLPSIYIPKTLHISQEQLDAYIGNNLIIDVYTELKNKNMTFPLIIKPDNGVRGLGVEIFHTQEEFEGDIYAYFEKNMSRGSWLLQEFINYPDEIGVFYTRLPGESKGKITGLVGKEFLNLIGNGRDPFEQLVRKHPRARFYIQMLQEDFAERRGEIITEGEHIDIVEIGTHSRGSTFLDISEKKTPGLAVLFDSISNNIEGFYYGRYDVRTPSVNALLDGNFKIIEVNMTYSEPTWMYDPKYSFWTQQKILLQHRSILYDIATANHKNGAPYASVSIFMKAKKAYEEIMG